MIGEPGAVFRRCREGATLGGEIIDRRHLNRQPNAAQTEDWPPVIFPSVLRSLLGLLRASEIATTINPQHMGVAVRDGSDRLELAVLAVRHQR